MSLSSLFFPSVLTDSAWFLGLKCRKITELRSAKVFKSSPKRAKFSWDDDFKVRSPSPPRLLARLG